MADSCTIALFKAGTAEYRRVQTAYIKEMFSAEKGEHRMNQDEPCTDIEQDEQR